MKNNDKLSRKNIKGLENIANDWSNRDITPEYKLANLRSFCKHNNLEVFTLEEMHKKGLFMHLDKTFYMFVRNADANDTEDMFEIFNCSYTYVSAHTVKMSKLGAPGKSIPFDQVKKMKEFNAITDMGWKVISTRRQFENGTIIFGFPDSFVNYQKSDDYLYRTDEYPFKIFMMYADKYKILPERVAMYDSGYIRTLSPKGTFDIEHDNMSPIGAFNPASENGWREGLTEVFSNMEKKLKRREKDGWIFYKTPELRYNVRGKLAGRTYFF